MKYLNLCLVILLISACANKDFDVAAYREEARSYCEVHSVEYWEANGQMDELNAMNPTDKQKKLMEVIRLSVKSQEMGEIIFVEGPKVSAGEFYPFLQKKIPELTKTPFDCPAIKDFYYVQ